MSLPALIKTDLAESEMAYVNLRRGHFCIKNISHNAVKRACVDILTKAEFDMGHKSMSENETMLQIQTEALYGELTGRYKYLTIPELQEAFQRGIRGDAGQFFGLCAQTYHKFIKWFYELPERQKAWLNYLNITATDQPTKEVTIDKLLFAREAAMKAFMTYKELQWMPAFSHAYYNIINEAIGVEINGRKTLIPDSAIRRMIFDRCKSELSDKLKREQKKAKATGRTLVANAIQTLLEQDFKGTNTLENEVKGAYLKYYFNQLIKNNQDLTL